jgi:hypothetical protein
MNAQCKEILWNVVNSFLAGFLVFIGAFSDGHLNQQGTIKLFHNLQNLLNVQKSISV